MKKQLLVFGVLFAISISLAAGVDAAFLKFTPTSANLTTGATTQIGIVVDSDSQEVLSSDVYVLYDTKVLDVQSVVYGTYFPSVQHNISAGKVTIRGHVQDAATSRKGAGTLATITFKALAPGTATLSFFCDMSASDTSKIVKNDINASNIIMCTQNNTSALIVVAPTSTPTPRPNVSGTAPTATPAGGAGGSNGGNNNGSSGSQGGPGNGGNANIGGNGSTGTAGGTNANGSPMPTQLPRTGSLDNLNGMAVAGTLLFVIGGIASLIL